MRSGLMSSRASGAFLENLGDRSDAQGLCCRTIIRNRSPRCAASSLMEECG